MTSSDARRRPADDAAYREAIARDLGTTMMVEAAAGTGKTSSLVTRAVALLREGVCGVATVAAITFTVKAAAQLRSRIEEGLERELRRLRAEGGPPEKIERLGAAVRDLDRAFIGTTHSFCARLLRERPIEAGLDPEFDEVDEIQATVLTADFWQRWYHMRAALGDERVARAIDAGLTEPMLRGSFVELADYHGDLEIVSEECARPDLAPAVAAVRGLLRTVEHDLPTDAMREKPDRFELMLRLLLGKERSRDLADPAHHVEFLEAACHGSNRPTLKLWPDGDRARACFQEHQRLFATQIRPALTRWREYVHCLAMNVIRPALDDFARERKETATVTFGDLLLAARDLLRDHASVRSYFQRRFTHLLVDEFQDTDPLQAEVLFYLTGIETEERAWTTLTPRPGSLFIVGDPKQSIYRFRRADISTYLAVRDRIAAAGGTLVPLSKNFRSSRPVCEFVNARFSTLFDAESVSARRQAPHVDLFAHHQGGAGDGVCVLVTPNADGEKVAAAEAETIASWIRRAVRSRMEVVEDGKTRPVEWSDFLLVSRGRRFLQHYAEALGREQVPFEVTGADGFRESRWLQAALPLLRAAADPDDPVAVVSFLRGIYCGASDEDLYRFVSARGSWSPFRPLPEGTPQPVSDGMGILSDAIALARSLPPAAAIAKIFERAGVTARAAADAQAGTAAGNVLLAQALARGQSARGESFASIVDWLAGLLDSRAEIEEMDVDPERENAVRLMNLHQVKGLEAAIVFLIDPVEGRGRAPSRHVSRTPEGSRGYFTIRQKKKEFTVVDVALPRGWEALSATEAEFEAAEERRLLYVAATRAKNLLVVGATVKDGTVGGRWADLASHAPRRLPPLAEVRAKDCRPEASPESFAAAAAAIDARRGAAHVPSYSVVPVTRVAHDSHERLVRAEEGLGKGTSWGRVLHRLFEAMPREPGIDLRLFAGSLLKDEERDAAEIEEVMATVEALRSSPLWSRVLAAEEKYAEVPFALNVEASSVGLDFEGDTLLHGTIDLVFREGDRWFVVDYKSDSTAGRLEQLIAYYRPQVEHYARFWAKLTGRRTEGGLFFVDGSHEAWLGAG